jgi:hypothetical protein
VVRGGGDGEERAGEHGQGDVAAPGAVAADLVVVQAGLVLGLGEAVHYRPLGPGDRDQLGQWQFSTRPAVPEN